MVQKTGTTLFLLVSLCSARTSIGENSEVTLEWKENYLSIHGNHLPGGSIVVQYLEAYCRANSQRKPWAEHTVVGHTTKLVSSNDKKTKLILHCTLSDGVTVDHQITAKSNEVDFRLIAHNPTNLRSEAHWAQPCVRVGTFTGTGPQETNDKYAYVKKSFIFLDGKLSMMPTRDWAMRALYVPGQVWAAPGVPLNDVNPRPLHPDIPSNGLIGCFSADNSMIFATAFEPYQELFQGVLRCLHSDFRLGGLKPLETLSIRGKIYLVKNDMVALLHRYKKDFPEHLLKPLPKR